MTVNENQPPSFSIADASRNWFEVLGQNDPTVKSAREIITAAQTVAGVTPDGNWGQNTSTALIAKARQMNFNSKYIAALEKAKNDRRLNIDAWRTAIGIGGGIQPQLIRFGANESSVQLPTYGAVAPGTASSTPAPTPASPPRPSTSTPARTPATRTPATTTDAQSKKWNPTTGQKVFLAVSGVALVGAVGFMVYDYKRQQSSNQKRDRLMNGGSPIRPRAAARSNPRRR